LIWFIAAWIGIGLIIAIIFGFIARGADEMSSSEAEHSHTIETQ
jgi:hypothetical protein